MSEKKEIPQNTYIVTIDGTDYTRYIPMPWKWSARLDERLDECRMSMKQCPVPIFEPMSEVKIRLSDKKNGITEMTYIVAADDSTEIPVGSGFYNHELMLIEETKKLEGIIIDSLTFTNSLGRTYLDNSREINVTVTDEWGPLDIKILPNEDKIEQIKKSLTPKKVGQPFTFMSLKSLFASYAANTLPTVSDWTEAEFVVKFDGKDLHTYREGSHTKPQDNNTLNDVAYTVDSLQSGTYTCTYKLSFFIGVIPPDKTVTVNYEFIAVANQQALPKWTVASVIDRLLDVGQVHLVSESPKYELNDEQEAEFAKIEAPEFAFSKMTLREALDQIGGFIHGMARLKGNTIYYDMLGGTEQATLADPKYPYVTDKYAQNIESYATELDSTVDNLVNILDADEGVITEPYGGGFKSVRSEEAYARITDGNMVISTSLPIYSVQKLLVRDPAGNIEDITPYLFEAAEYGLMSSYDGTYPRSKAFAIYYTQGQKNIKGLSFKVPSVIGGAGSKYAIANIIKSVGGDDITSDWWDKESKYPTLWFQITYTPIFTSRVKQHKLYYKDFKHPRTLAYNQSANLVETRYYGENMRGLIARTGNIERIRTYRLACAKYIPKIGQMWGEDYYVSSVNVAIFPFYIDCMIGLSKDFNRLSEYIGINSIHRIYEVSEKQAYDRDIAYVDYCVIGDAEESDGLALIADEGISVIADTFIQSGLAEAITGAGVTTIAEDGAERNMTLPAISTAFGNTLVFSFYMEDSYSAGRKSVYGDNGEVSGYWQTNVEYNDYYGRFENMKVQFFERGYTPYEGSKAPYNLPQGIEWGPTIDDRLPPISTSDNNPLKVRKNSTEIIRMHYQIHYVTNRKDLIVGPALTHNCPLVRGVKSNHSAALYVLQNPLGKFADKINLSTATKIWDYSNGGITTQKSLINLQDKHSTVDGDAWAIVDSATGELLIGSNTPVKNGETITLPSLTFKHNLNTEV
jgi:hypothetical protein